MAVIRDSFPSNAGSTQPDPSSPMEAIIPPSGGETPAAQLGPNTADIAAHLYALFSPMFVHDYPDAQIEIAYADMTTGDQKLNKAKQFSAFDLQKAADSAGEKNREGRNIDVGVALRSAASSGRAKKTEIQAVRMRGPTPTSRATTGAWRPPWRRENFTRRWSS